MSDDHRDRFLEACDLYQRKDFKGAKNSFESLLGERGLSSNERRDCLFNIAACLASMGQFRDALEQFNSINLNNSQEIRYNRALCHYKLSNFEEALEVVSDLLHADEELPETGASKDGRIGRRKECLNLKLAILFKLGPDQDPDAAQSLIDEVNGVQDDVTLHNQSLYPADIESATDGLLGLIDDRGRSSPGGQIPAETFENLLKLTLMQGNHALVSELMSKYNRDEMMRARNIDLYEILAERKRVPDKTTCKKLEHLLDKFIGQFGQITDDSGQAPELVGLIEATTKQLAVILWENCQYSLLERIMLKVEPILIQTDYWPIWYAHSLFMQDTRYEECCFLYEKLLPNSGPASSSETLLNVDPIVLANLCVSYLLTARNEAAESLIKGIETEEANSASDSSTKMSRSCIVNLTIGQLYCVKLNFSFGLMRIFKTLEPLDERLDSETWLICKRCILSLLDNHCKSMIYVRDDLFDQVIRFLMDCEQHGIYIRAATSYKLSAKLETNLSEQEKLILMGRNSVTYEARYLRSLMLTVLHD